MEEWIGLVPVLVPVLVPGLAAPTAQRSGDENDGTRSCRRKSILLRPRLHRLARAAISRAATARWLRLVVFSAGFLSCTWPHFGNDFWVFVCLFSPPPPKKKMSLLYLKWIFPGRTDGFLSPHPFFFTELRSGSRPIPVSRNFANEHVGYRTRRGTRVWEETIWRHFAWLISAIMRRRRT